MKLLSGRWLRGMSAVASILTIQARAQAPLPIYTDHLVDGFQDWSWASRNLGNTSPVHTGSGSIQVTASAWQALALHSSTPIPTVLYSNLTFWVHGGTSGGQPLQVQATVNQTAVKAVSIAAPVANTWQQRTVSLAALGLSGKSNFDGIWIQNASANNLSPFYVDDIQLTAAPAPGLVHLSVNATQAVRTVDARWFGVNTAIWDENFDTPQTVSLLNEMGARVLRYPGGSLSDEYHWASNKTGTNTWQWTTSFSKFVHVATNVGAEAFITVNYGTGTPAEAAAWVRHSNVTNHYGFKYWEIGNECYGTWEKDSNASPHDAYTYAVRAKDYLQQMKAADPTIKIGVVVAPGETNYDTGSHSHPAYNPRTGQTNYGWTAVLLTTLKSLGVTPDFAVHHRYPEWTGQESDPLLLQSSVAWASEAADLRRQINDYFGAGGTNIELVCTENNSNAGDQGKQSTSLVNGLYYADSLAQLMKTELNAFVWWDLRNGTDTNGSMDPLLYGWRTYGDLGMINGLTTRHPTFYAAKLMQYFARPGDNVLNATSDHLLLSAYAARQAIGAVSLLVINKDPVAALTAQISLSGFAPAGAAAVRSYGVPQDAAAQTGLGSPDIARTDFVGAAGTFTNTFAPYSVSLFTLAPSAPVLVPLLGPQQPPGQFVFQLQGQPGVRYILLSSSNLTNWLPVSTNTPTGSVLSITNATLPGPGRQFWRAVWQP